MQKIILPPYSRESKRMLIFGLYAVLCHTVFIALYCLTPSESIYDYILFEDLGDLLENTFVSLAAVFVGSYILDISMIEQKK